MGQVKWSQPSIEDLKDIFDFYKEKSVTAAIHMVEGIEIAGNTLTPEFLYQREPNLNIQHRRILYKHYKIIYEVEENTIEILRVFDSRKDPNALTI